MAVFRKKMLWSYESISFFVEGRKPCLVSLARSRMGKTNSVLQRGLGGLVCSCREVCACRCSPCWPIISTVLSEYAPASAPPPRSDIKSFICSWLSVELPSCFFTSHAVSFNELILAEFCLSLFSNLRLNFKGCTTLKHSLLLPTFILMPVPRAVRMLNSYFWRMYWGLLVPARTAWVTRYEHDVIVVPWSVFIIYNFLLCFCVCFTCGCLILLLIYLEFMSFIKQGP